MQAAADSRRCLFQVPQVEPPAAPEAPKDVPSAAAEPPAAEATVTPVVRAAAPVTPEPSPDTAAEVAASTPQAVSPAEGLAVEEETPKDAARSVADLIQLHKTLSMDQPASPSLRVPTPEQPAEEAPSTASEEASAVVSPPVGASQMAAALIPAAAAEVAADAVQEAASPELPQEEPPEQGADVTSEEPPAASGVCWQIRTRSKFSAGFETYMRFLSQNDPRSVSPLLVHPVVLLFCHNCAAYFLAHLHRFQG